MTKKLSLLRQMLLVVALLGVGGANCAWATNIVVSWAVSSAPTGGTPFQVKSSDELENVLQVALGTPQSGDSWSATTSDAVTTVSYSGKNYNFAKYAQTTETNGSSSSSLAANGSSEYNYITFVPKYDGTVVVVGHNLGTNNASKATWCYEDGVVKSGIIIGTGSSNIAYDGKTDVYSLNGGQLTGGIKFTVKGGSTYTLSIQGSKARWCGVIYDYADPWNTLYKKTSSDWADADLTEWVAGSTYSRTTSSIDNGFKVVATGNSTNKTETYTFTKTISVRNKSSLILDLQWYANNPNGNSQYSYVTFGDIRIRFSSQNGNMWIKFGDSDEQQLITSAGTGLRGATWNVNFIVDQYLHTVNYSIASSKYNSGTAITGSGTSSATFNNVVLGYKGGYNYDYDQSIKSITIKESAKVGYTINYTYGGEIIASEEGTEYKGETVNASKTYVWNEGNTQKYYVSGEATTSFVIENDNASSNVFEVALREANASATTTLNAYAGGEVIKENIQITYSNFAGTNVGIEGEATKVYYPAYVYVGGKYYKAPKNGSEPYYGISTTYGATENITYTLDETVAYYIEAEDMTVVKKGSIGGWRDDVKNTAADRFSGTTPRHYKSNFSYTPALPNGIYTLYLYGRHQGKSGTETLNIYTCLPNGTGETDTGLTIEWSGGATTTNSVAGVQIPEGASLAIRCNTDNNSNINQDFLYLVRTGDYTVSTTLGSNGYTTFASPYALDLTSENLPTGLTAYKAAVDGTKVRFTALDQTVPANTGILLKGTASTPYDINVVVSGTAVSENAFLVNTGGLTFDAESGYTYFGMIKDSNPLTFGMFAPGSVAIPANKAYLKVADENLSRLVAVFDDETNGISQIENGELKLENSVYDLQGRRVAKPTKGLYIVNGRKVVLK